MVKIEPGKPLPDHTRLDYDECCAKLTLEAFFPDRYCNLVLADKPDLHGDGVGIEVTLADDRKKQEAVNNWVKANSCSDENRRAFYIERMRQLGVEYTGGVQGWPGFDTSFRQIAEAVEKKINRLKTGNYKSFPRYELFIITDIWLSPEKKAEADRYFFYGEINAYFQTVYVFSQGYEFHIYNTKDNNHQLLLINSSEQTKRNIRARQMVEEGECE